MPKPKIGEKRLVDTDDPKWLRVVTVASREVHNHREFYRVNEIEGALFLSSSLHHLEWQPA